MDKATRTKLNKYQSQIEALNAKRNDPMLHPRAVEQVCKKILALHDKKIALLEKFV